MRIILPVLINLFLSTSFAEGTDPALKNSESEQTISADSVAPEVGDNLVLDTLGYLKNLVKAVYTIDEKEWERMFPEVVLYKATYRFGSAFRDLDDEARANVIKQAKDELRLLDQRGSK